MSSPLNLGFRNPLITISIRSRSMQTAARRISISKRAFIWGSSNRLFATSSSSSESVEEPKRRRVSKQERRAMLEEFVDRYRASNAGRFPTAFKATKQIGGSYYVARQVIQELEYNHRMSPKKSEKPMESEKKIDVFESRTGLSADKGEDPLSDKGEVPLSMDGEAVRLPGVKLPLISSDSGQALLNESASSSTSEIVHSNELVVEHIENCTMGRQILSDDHNDKEALEQKTDVVESRTELSAGMSEDPLLMNGEAVRMPEVKLHLISSDSEQALVKERTSSLTAEVVHSYLLVVEHVKNSSTSTQILSDDHDDKKAVDMGYPSGHYNENSKHNVHESTEVQADSSIPRKSESEVDILRTPVNDIQGTREEKASFASARGGVDLRSNEEEVSKSDNLDGGNSRMLVENTSSPKRSGIWGNLRSLADSIIGLWKKM